MNAHYALFIALSVGVLAGAKCEPPPDPPPDPSGTPCERACARMAQLDCEGHEGAPDGSSCAEVCENQEASGIARFCPEDVAAIESCDELNDAYAACD